MDLDDLFGGHRSRRKHHSSHGHGHESHGFFGSGHGDSHGHGHDDHHDDDHRRHDHGHEGHQPYGYQRPKDYRDQHDHADHEYLDRGSSWSRHGAHHGHHGDLFDLEHLARRLFADKRLLLGAAVVALVVIGLAAFLVLPILGQVAGAVDSNGVEGVVDRLWHGSPGGRG